MTETVTLSDVLKLAEQLSPIDKVRLIERVAPQLERDLKDRDNRPRQPLRGLWKGIDITADDIDKLRQEMWSTFPSEDI